MTKLKNEDMSNTKHTPEPTYIALWFDNVYWHGSLINDVEAHKKGVAESEADFTYVPLAQAAAAPELLENLARIIDRIEESGLQNNFPSAHERAKAAINKATS